MRANLFVSSLTNLTETDHPEFRRRGFISTIATFQEIGQWDNVSYVAGVSGSCWAIGESQRNLDASNLTGVLIVPASMYTLPLSPPVTAPLSALPLLDHFKDVAGTHPLSAAGMRKVADAAGGNEALLGPLKSKHQAGESVCCKKLCHTFSRSQPSEPMPLPVIDLYSTLTTSYFWLVGGKQGMPRVEASVLFFLVSITFLTTLAQGISSLDASV